MKKKCINPIYQYIYGKVIERLWVLKVLNSSYTPTFYLEVLIKDYDSLSYFSVRPEMMM